jgi:hypothetical protein
VIVFYIFFFVWKTLLLSKNFCMEEIQHKKGRLVCLLDERSKLRIKREREKSNTYRLISRTNET